MVKLVAVLVTAAAVGDAFLLAVAVLCPLGAFVLAGAAAVVLLASTTIYRCWGVCGEDGVRLVGAKFGRAARRGLGGEIVERVSKRRTVLSISQLIKTLCAIKKFSVLMRLVRRVLRPEKQTIFQSWWKCQRILLELDWKYN